jgi:hypothetical protein
MGYIFASREDPISTDNLGFYNNGAFTTDATPASLLLATYFDTAVQGEPLMFANLSSAQRSDLTKYVVPLVANRLVSLTGTLNAYIVRLLENVGDTATLKYWNGTDFTVGASAAELNLAEVYPDSIFNEPELYQRRAFIQESAPSQYVELIRVAVSIFLV